MNILSIVAPYLVGILVIAHLLPRYLIWHILIREHNPELFRGINKVMFMLDAVCIMASMTLIGMMVISIII